MPTRSRATSSGDKGTPGSPYLPSVLLGDREGRPADDLALAAAGAGAAGPVVVHADLVVARREAAVILGAGGAGGPLPGAPAVVRDGLRRDGDPVTADVGHV